MKQQDLTLQEYKLYARHLILPEIQLQGQKRLKNAKVLCIGAGALGAINLLYLAACGIGNIGIVDNDIIELSNLHRQIIYNFNDLGHNKATSAQTRLRSLNTQCKINTYNTKITNDNALQIIKLYDIIIDGTDNFNAKYCISYACHTLHKVHIYGAVYGFEGHISVFNYQSGPNYKDIYKSLYLKMCQPCTQGGIIGVVPGLIGIIQATETIKIILGLGEVLTNSILIYNSTNMSFKKTSFNLYNQPLNKNRYTLKQNYKIQYINVSKLLKIINNNVIRTYIVDVREKQEYTISHIKGAINIPLYKLTLIKHINNLKIYSINKHIIIYCSNDQRSIIASEILHTIQISHWILHPYRPS